MKKIIAALIFLVILARPVFAEGGVEYNLPYPGLLPDSPVYILKVARDKVTEFFIRDQKQKAFYLLFLSDKRLAAGKMLSQYGKVDLGATTVLKAQGYYTQAVDLGLKIKDQDLTAKLVVAGAKHEEVISEMPASEKLQTALLLAQKDKNRVLELMMVK